MNKEEILLSIIVPVYNVEKYLSRCLDSLLRITSITYEIILVNDGSTDNSLQICREYQERYPNLFKVFTQTNRGQSAARNRGLKEATARYIAFVDSDDSVQEGTLEQSVSFLEENVWCDIVQFPVLLEAGSGKEQYILAGLGLIRGGAHLLYDFSTKESISWRVCDKVFRHTLIQGIEFREGLVYEDNLYMCEALLRSKGVYLSDYGCYYYYYNPTSTTHARSEKSYVDMCVVHGEMYLQIAKSTDNSTIRTHMLYRVVNDMFASYKLKGRHHPCVLAGLPYLHKSEMKDILISKELSLPRRLKIILAKLYSYLTVG